jgi:hypothetical protein
MLRSLKDLRGVALRAIDGDIGKVDDFYFDDEGWGIRYLVVDTGIWLSGREVLISPIRQQEQVRHQHSGRPERRTNEKSHRRPPRTAGHAVSSARKRRQA